MYSALKSPMQVIGRTTRVFCCAATVPEGRLNFCPLSPFRLFPLWPKSKILILPDFFRHAQSRLVTPGHAQSRDFQKKRIVYFFMNHLQKTFRQPFCIGPIRPIRPICPIRDQPPRVCARRQSYIVNRKFPKPLYSRLIYAHSFPFIPIHAHSRLPPGGP